MKRTDRMRKLGPSGQKIAEKLAGTLSYLQHVWTGQMEKYFGKLSKSGQKLVLVLFFSAGCLWNLWMIARPLKKTQPVNLPELTFHGKTRIEFPDRPDADTMAVNRTRRFLYWFDGLQNTRQGKLKRDSILRERPALVDSARALLHLIE